MSSDKIQRLLDAAGKQTHAESAGITLADEPAPLYQLWTVTDLRKRAGEIGIVGRSSMNKQELIRALRDH